MAICAYCGTDRPATREHIIPSWYYKYDPSPNDVGFNERAKGKIVKTELAIRDVCEGCNSGALSDLDSYGRDLFFSSLVNYVYVDSKTELSYDYSLLVRWLLKISYNSARAHNSDTEILGQYKNVVLGTQTIPEHLILRLRTIAPTTGGVYDIAPAKKQSPTVDHPDWFRVGVFRPRSFDSMYWSFRQITINSYSFLLFLPDISESSEAIKEIVSIRRAIDQEADESILVDHSGNMAVPEPITSSINYNLTHLGNFPFAYDLVESDTIKAALEDKDRLINYWIDRTDIEAQTIGNTLSFLNDLVSSREVCMGLAERLEISIHGYNDDPRELYEIPEVVSFLQALDREWSYWMLFQHPECRWIQMLFVCLSNPVKTEAGRVELDPELMRHHMDRWFVSLNELSHQFAISLTVNKRVSLKAAEILMKGSEDFL